MTEQQTTQIDISTERESLEAALAQAEASRKYLEAALEEAKATLVNTVTDLAKTDKNIAEASAKVDKIRARCRQLRAALADPALSELITRSRERIDTLASQSEKLSKREDTASPPSIELSEHAARGENKRLQDQSRWRKLTHQIYSVLTTSPLVWQTIRLLALVLAYLQYYFLDVQLQIMHLPSVIYIATR